MIGKKIILLNIVMVLILITGSFLTGAASVKLNMRNILTMDNDEIEIYTGKMIIDCEWDSIACEIDVVDSPYEKLDIKNQDEVVIRFYADWEIKNEKTAYEEKWFFEIVLKNGFSPDDEVIDTKNVMIEDTPFIPDNQNGTLYFDGLSLGRDDFEGDVFLQKPEIKNFRIELRCEYYRGSWIDNDLELLSEEDLWTVARIDLSNDKPTKPRLYGDIGEGETGDIDKTYSFTAESSVDPDGDMIKYVFFWNDNTLDETSYMESGGAGTESHRWEDGSGPHKVLVYAVDRFGAVSPSVELNFVLPRSHSRVLGITYSVFEHYCRLFRFFNLDLGII